MATDEPKEKPFFNCYEAGAALSKAGLIPPKTRKVTIVIDPSKGWVRMEMEVYASPELVPFLRRMAARDIWIEVIGQVDVMEMVTVIGPNGRSLDVMLPASVAKLLREEDRIDRIDRIDDKERM